MALLFAMQVLLARWLGADEFGVYGLAMAWVTVAAAVSAFGAPTAVLRFVPEFLTRGDTGMLRGVIRASLGVSFGLGLLVAAGVTLLISTTSVLPTDLEPVFLVGIWIVPVLAFTEAQGGVSRAFHKPVIALAPLWVGRPILIIVIAGMLGMATGVLEAQPAIVATLLSILIVAVAQFLLLRTTLSEAIGSDHATYAARQWIRVATPLWLVAVFSLLAHRADLLIIGAFMTTADVGLYEAASKTALLANMPLAAVNFLAAPIFASLFTAGDRHSLAGTAVSAARMALWPTLPLVLVLMIFGEQILSLFGDVFVEVRWELAILALAQLVGTAAGSVGYLLNVTGHQDDTLRTLTVVSIANVLLNVLVVPVWGLTGAAIVTACTTVGWNLWLYSLVKKRLGFGPSAINTARLVEPLK